MVPALHRALISLVAPVRVLATARMRRRAGWEPARIRTFQEGRLRRIVRYAWAHVPFYRERWAGIIAGPEEIRTLDDLPRLPILTKDDVRARRDALVTDVRRHRGTEARTGGSTGRPILFRMTRYDSELMWAEMFTGWMRTGWRIGEPFLVVGGESVATGPGSRRSRADRIMNRFVFSGSNVTDERVRALADSPEFGRFRLLYGYPNALRELAERLARIGRAPPALRGVICTAEVMRPEVRNRIAELFGGVPVLDQWGLNDGALHACDGPERDGLYLSFHRGILEILDESGGPIREPGVPGRAVATSVTNLAFPFVRYETGDRLHWHEGEPSPLGIRWARLGPPDGRTGDVIRLSSGRSIAMPGLTLVMRWVEGLERYQFIQTGPDQVTARLEPGPGFGLDEAAAKAFLRERIGAEIEWTVVFGAPELTANGKLLVVVVGNP